MRCIIGASLGGWNAAIATPEETIANLKKFDPKADPILDLASLKRAKPYYLDANGKGLKRILSRTDNAGGQ